MIHITKADIKCKPVTSGNMDGFEYWFAIPLTNKKQLTMCLFRNSHESNGEITDELIASFNAGINRDISTHNLKILANETI